MKKQLTIFDALAQGEPPRVGALVAGETIASRKAVRGRFQGLSASGEWLVRDRGDRLILLDKTTCEVLGEGQGDGPQE